MTIFRTVLAVVFAIWVAKSTAAEETRTAAQEQRLPFEWSIPGTVQDEAGEPVSGAIVATLPGSSKQISTTSDKSGQFVLEMRSLHPVTYEAGIAEFAWIPANLEGRISFLTRHRGYHCPKDPVFETENAVLTAHVLRVATVRGKATHADGSPVAGVHLQGEGRGNTNHYFRGYTVTRDDGTYEFDIFPDQRTIIAVADELYGASSHIDILLKEGQLRESVDFVVNDGTLIRGKITLGDDHHPVVGDHATLIQSAAGTDLVRFRMTDTKGFYRFRVGPGDYELRLANQDAARPIHITVEDETDVAVKLAAATAVSGIVRTKNGEPVAPADWSRQIESANASGLSGFAWRQKTSCNCENR